MRSLCYPLRIVGFAAAALLGGIMLLADRSELATDIGAASVTVSGETARVVENVVYRQDVTRLGDVLLVDGQPAEPITEPTVAAMWEIVAATWPVDHRARLRQLSVIEERPRNLVGVVHPSSVGGWVLSLDAADLADRALIEETIVHELAHVLTLDPSVFTFGDGGCGGERIELGCAHAGSVLADFTAAFWPDRTRGDDAEYVNDYAGSAPHEDLAETFTSMVWGWTPAGEVIDAKTAMLAADPGLAALATELRVLLDS
ncbi:MAG: hypothetical protein L7U56_03040 [Acidimicrobiales bacterium]|nr:hypothetical protein [Acidimicrobiales bacterium]